MPPGSWRTKKSRGTTHTLSFDMEFEEGEDVCYLAYAHPYTYSDLQLFLDKLGKDPKVPRHTYSRKLLSKTMAGNRCDLLTITAPPFSSSSSSSSSSSKSSSPKKDGATAANASGEKQRRLVVLSARVHPGETNASWVMQGCLEFLTSIHPAKSSSESQLV